MSISLLIMPIEFIKKGNDVFNDKPLQTPLPFTY